MHSKKDQSLISQIEEKISHFDPFDLISILGMDFFGCPEDFAKAQHEVTQVCNEYVTGLLSSKLPAKRSLPTPKDTKDIAELFQKLVFTYFYENLPANKQDRCLFFPKHGRSPFSLFYTFLFYDSQRRRLS